MSLTAGAYIGLVLGIGLLLIAGSVWWLDSVRRARRQRLEPKRRFDGIATRSPIADPAATARRQAVDRIERHFSFTRIVLPLLGGAVLLATSLPFLQRAPAALVSLLIGGGTVRGVPARRDLGPHLPPGAAAAGRRAVLTAARTPVRFPVSGRPADSLRSRAGPGRAEQSPRAAASRSKARRRPRR